MLKAAIPLFLLLAPCLVGCGEGGPKTHAVSGAVTFESKPLAEGDIVFEPEDGAGAPDGAKIENGKYNARVKPGKHRVRITAQREIEGKAEVGAMGESLKPKEQYLPAKYNEATELKTEVPGGKYNFEL